MLATVNMNNIKHDVFSVYSVNYTLKLASNCCSCVMPRSSPDGSTAVPTACTECSRGFMLSNPSACWISLGVFESGRSCYGKNDTQ